GDGLRKLLELSVTRALLKPTRSRLLTIRHHGQGPSHSPPQLKMLGCVQTAPPCKSLEANHFSSGAPFPSEEEVGSRRRAVHRLLRTLGATALRGPIATSSQGQSWRPPVRVRCRVGWRRRDEQEEEEEKLAARDPGTYAVCGACAVARTRRACGLCARWRARGSRRRHLAPPNRSSSLLLLAPRARGWGEEAPAENCATYGAAGERDLTYKPAGPVGPSLSTGPCDHLAGIARGAERSLVPSGSSDDSRHVVQRLLEHLQHLLVRPDLRGDVQRGLALVVLNLHALVPAVLDDEPGHVPRPARRCLVQRGVPPLVDRVAVRAAPKKHGSDQALVVSAGQHQWGVALVVQDVDVGAALHEQAARGRLSGHGGVVQRREAACVLRIYVEVISVHELVHGTDVAIRDGLKKCGHPWPWAMGEVNENGPAQAALEPRGWAREWQ
ncbi:unnamed protein product, partial [Prorocentrum cordatum]